MGSSLPGSSAIGFSSQEYWNGVLVPYPEYFPDPVIEPMSLALGGRVFKTELPGKPTLKLLTPKEV